MLYEYVCDSCSFVDSYFHKMDEKPEIICPTCGEKMRKALGLNAVVKCDGFYSSESSYSDAKVIKQSVMGIDQSKVGEVDQKTKKNSFIGKVKD